MNESKNIKDFFSDLGYGELSDLEGFDGSEVVTGPVYNETSEDFTIWAWSSDAACGFIRDDSTGLSAISDTSRDNQLMLAAWNADFDIRLLKDYLTESYLETALDDAEENMWGFRDGRNMWDEA